MEKSKIIFYFTKYYFIKIIRVADLAHTIELEQKPTIEELLCTIVNRDEVEELVKRPVRFCFYLK
jgi:hypothetical protein